METGTVLRLAASVILAIGGLFLTRTHMELSSDQLGVLVFAGAVLFGYRTVAAHFDGKDRG